ncbi:hypothetical protein WMY93_000156 [Mugilogobius chulae]|uniref:AIG1-type G domain-containing protein n=1 Tax=Mugilogobius chulae TaxID=88201 RepID=A0AAW0Q041_9GOBI
MKDGRCTSCSGKCPVDDHVKEKWKYVTKTITMDMTSKQLKDKFEKNDEGKTPLLQKLEKEMSDLQEAKDECLDEAFDLVQKLEKNALNVNSVFTFVHLEFLIEKMKEKNDEEVVKVLEEMRNRMSVKNQAAAKYSRVVGTDSLDTPAFERGLTFSHLDVRGAESWAVSQKEVIKGSKKIDDGPPARYQLQLRRVNLDKESDEESKLRKFTLGERDPKYLNKTILLVGETGSGKTTLINALVVTDEEESTQSQTSAVSVYEVFGLREQLSPFSDHSSTLQDSDTLEEETQKSSQSSGRRKHTLCQRREKPTGVFQFNNCQNETIEDESDEDEKEAFMTSVRGMQKFTTFVETTKPQSLEMNSRSDEK